MKHSPAGGGTWEAEPGVDIGLLFSQGVGGADCRRRGEHQLNLAHSGQGEGVPLLEVDDARSSGSSSP